LKSKKKKKRGHQNITITPVRNKAQAKSSQVKDQIRSDQIIKRIIPPLYSIARLRCHPPIRSRSGINQSHQIKSSRNQSSSKAEQIVPPIISSDPLHLISSHHHIAPSTHPHPHHIIKANPNPRPSFTPDTYHKPEKE
jgi:hypothetical protein